MPATATSEPTNAASGSESTGPMRAGRAERDRARGAEARAGGGAEQVRIGERVAEHALVGAAGHPEHPADHQPEHDARQPQLVEDERVRRRQAVADRDERQVVRQLVQHASRRQLDRPHEQPGQRAQQGQPDRAEQHAEAQSQRPVRSTALNAAPAR